MTTGRPDTAASVSTHVLDTAAGRPAAGVPVRISSRGGPHGSAGGGQGSAGGGRGPAGGGADPAPGSRDAAPGGGAPPAGGDGAARGGSGTARAPAGWTELGSSATDADGRCRDLPAPPPGTAEIRLDFETGTYLARNAGNAADTRTGAASPDPAPPAAGPAFFPEVTVTFAVEPGQHYHVPLLLSPFGYSVYRGS